MKMVKNLGGRSVLFRFQNRFNLFGTRHYCSSPQNKKSNDNTTVNRSSKNDESSSSLSNYNEQYKALSNLDFMKAAKILFNEQPKKKEFGLDFHLVQLFFACFPSLSVYLLAMYARSEMRKMYAEKEARKQMEFEAMAKKLELKAAERKAAVASNPELLELKERLGKIEETVTQIIGESRRKSSDVQSESNRAQAAQAKTLWIDKEKVRHQWHAWKLLVLMAHQTIRLAPKSKCLLRI